MAAQAAQPTGLPKVSSANSILIASIILICLSLLFFALAAALVFVSAKTQHVLMERLNARLQNPASPQTEALRHNDAQEATSSQGSVQDAQGSRLGSRTSTRFIDRGSPPPFGPLPTIQPQRDRPRSIPLMTAAGRSSIPNDNTTTPAVPTKSPERDLSSTTIAQAIPASSIFTQTLLPTAANEPMPYRSNTTTSKSATSGRYHALPGSSAAKGDLDPTIGTLPNEVGEEMELTDMGVVGKSPRLRPASGDLRGGFGG